MSVLVNRPEPSLEAFWDRAAISKLEAKFAVANEMAALPRLPIQQLRSIVFQYRYFTQAFVTDLALLVARCPEGRLRSLIGQLVNEELGSGDPEAAHLRLYDRFLESIGAVDLDAGADELCTRIHPRVRELLADLRDRTVNNSTFYAIGMRGMGGECVCGVYFSVMYIHLRKHPFIVEHESRIDWRFWDIHAGHADVVRIAAALNSLPMRFSAIGRLYSLTPITSSRLTTSPTWMPIRSNNTRL